MLPWIDVKTEAMVDNKTLNLKHRAFWRVRDIFNYHYLKRKIKFYYITPISFYNKDKIRISFVFGLSLQPFTTNRSHLELALKNGKSRDFAFFGTW